MIKEFKSGGKTFYQVTPEQLLDMGFSQSDIDAALQAQNVEGVMDSRRMAYRAESDPLFLEWQYDQTPEAEQAWRDKVAEIKARYPLPAE